MRARVSLAVLVALLGACSRPHDDEAGGGTPAVVGAGTAVARIEAMPQLVLAIGTVTPRPGRFAELAAPAPTRVARIFVSPGLLSVGPIGLVMRLAGKDPLDRGLAPEPSFWRKHEPNPLGVEAAARHQF